ncbi:MAG TPA: hypothetical protein VFA28_17930 [Bryobacteraceae bacterium]|nr:hypothetical protein [Bryobacteraceae bacterium]
MKSCLAAAAIFVLACTPADGRRLDEYLQGAIISVEKSRVQAQMTLTPGVAVLPIVIEGIDADADGVISEAEQRAYAARVLRDVSLSVDRRPLKLQVRSVRFPRMEEMKDGRGEIEIKFEADLPAGGPDRRLAFENHHYSRIAAYQVNCLVPRDPDIRIVAQTRNYEQSMYELEYVQANASPGPLRLTWWSGGRGWLGTAALILLARLAFVWGQRARAASGIRGLRS